MERANENIQNKYNISRLKLQVVVTVIKENNGRHGKSGDLGDPGSQKILQIAEDLNKNIEYFLQKSIYKTKQKSSKVNTVY